MALAERPVTRVAVVDLGTNSTRLLVADVADGRLAEVDRLLAVTRLGQGVDASRRLHPDAIARVSDCLARYRAAADAHGATVRVAVATSAVRDAADRDAFLALVEREHGFVPRLLSGAEEAELAFRGVTAGRTLAGPTLVLDVGGGSTELVVGNGRGVAFRTSLDVGCVRVSERFLHGDPPLAGELERCAAHVRAELGAHAAAMPRPVRAIGVAGTAITLATLDLGLEEESEAVHGHVLPAAAIAAEADRLAAATHAAIAARRGIHPQRAPVIAGGAIVVREALAFAGADALEVSLQDILHGAALAAV
ncbi:MAG: hypothetical protein R3C15_04430 [Thermoleophilia bacterium]